MINYTAYLQPVDAIGLQSARKLQTYSNDVIIAGFPKSGNLHAIYTRPKILMYYVTVQSIEEQFLNRDIP